LVEIASGARHEICSVVLNAPDANDKHEIHVPENGEALHLICVFSPALEGTEVHGVDGSYTLRKYVRKFDV
jgi:L-ectoine synthase